MPDEVRDLLAGLSDPENLGLIVALMKHGKMSFNEMKHEFQISPSSLTNRLAALQNGNLIVNFYDKTDSKNFSYYDVTDIPEQIFESVYDTLYSPSVAKSDLIAPINEQQSLSTSRSKEKPKHIPVESLIVRSNQAVTDSSMYASNSYAGT